MSFNFGALLAPQNLLLAGVGVNVAATLGRAIFHTPKQRAQIDAIARQVNSTLVQVEQVLPSVQAATRSANRAAAGANDLTLALNALPLALGSAPNGAASNTSSPNGLNGVQGGAS